MTERGRNLRVGATVLVLSALLAGTIWGNDDHFPFGPFRMYSTTNEPDGTVNTVKFSAINAEGKEIFPAAQDFGLRPAEINGQVARFREDPELLSHLASAYEKAHPDRPPLIEIFLMYGLYQLEDSRPVGYSEVPIARWRRG